MDKNEKIGFAVLAAVVVVQGMQARSFRKRVRVWSKAVGNIIDSMAQSQYDTVFEDIISHLDD